MDQRKVVGKRTIGTGKWIKLIELEYSSDETNKNLKWEMVERTTKIGSSVDGINSLIEETNSLKNLGVDIIAILETEPLKQIILVSQFRPPLDAHCIEFPAGLITEIEETPISAAMRELYVIKTC
jgi:ADP-ribose pyrophosphatase